MPPEIRKTLLHVENTLIEGGKAAEKPLILIAAIAVIKNPWAGQGFVDDLAPAIRDCAPGLGEMLTKMVLSTRCISAITTVTPSVQNLICLSATHVALQTRH